MKILFTCQPAVGHLHPMLPLARALERAGHEVVFAASPAFHSWIAQAGFQAVSAGPDWLESEVEKAFPDLAVDPTSMEDLSRVWMEVFSRSGQLMIPDLISLIKLLSPSLVVSESLEFSAPLAAEISGVPHALIGISAYQPVAGLPHISKAWNRARIGAGLPSDPDTERLCPYLYLETCPPGLSVTSRDHGLEVAHLLRPVLWETSLGDIPEWLEGLNARPLVYVTMGTVFNRTRGVFLKILAALREEKLDAVVTVGWNQDPAALGPQPSHIRVHRYIPQSLLLPRTDLLISHEGYSTIMGALVHGIPIVGIPLGVGQALNAKRVAACGAGVCLDIQTATQRTIQSAIREVLGNPLCRYAAGRLRSEIQGMPPPDKAVMLLEHLASLRQPIRRNLTLH
jgi:UDP:flavonoid glycosyltransferase YjiC (YdhE family)